MIGYFNWSTDKELYKVFYQSSIMSHSIDSENTIRYGVVINKNLWKRLLNFNIKTNSKNIVNNMDIKIAAFSSFGLERVSFLFIIV
jgi:hypothetical protein